MKQTAVEWLIDKHFGGIDNCTPDFRNHIKQAKEMEKQQIIDAYNEGWTQCNVFELPERSRKHFETPEQYYNETFKK